MADKDLEITKKEVAELDTVAHNIVAYSEDDRRKADQLYEYYQELISKGDTKGDTRIALAKSLELKEMSVQNLIEILKLKTRLLEKRISLQIAKEMSASDNGNQRMSGFDTSKIISEMDKVGDRNG
jgi:hypothetical protein